MASIGAKAEMDKVATNRLDAAIDTLSLRFGLVRPEPRNAAGDGHLKAIYDREDMATLLEQLIEETAGDFAPAMNPFQSNVVTLTRIDPATGKETELPLDEELPDDAFVDVVIAPETEDDMGGKPSKGTPADKPKGGEGK